MQSPAAPQSRSGKNEILALRAAVVSSVLSMNGSEIITGGANRRP